MPSRPVMDIIAESVLRAHLDNIEKISKSDAIAMTGPLVPPLEPLVRRGLDSMKNKKDNLLVILSTFGGIVHTVEKMVRFVRRSHKHVSFLIPDEAMSAGTVFVLSGDEILMNYHSQLGPVDPQVYDSKQDELVPALSYLSQFEKLNDKAKKTDLTAAELVLIDNLDAGKLHQYGQEKELTVELIEDWLVQYKFKDWSRTDTHGKKVTEKMKRDTAKKIANILSNNEMWHSHSRGLDIKTLEQKVGLKIEDYSSNTVLYNEIRDFMSVIEEYLAMSGKYNFVLTRGFFA